MQKSLALLATSFAVTLTCQLHAATLTVLRTEASATATGGALSITDNPTFATASTPGALAQASAENGLLRARASTEYAGGAPATASAFAYFEMTLLYEGENDLILAGGGLGLEWSSSVNYSAVSVGPPPGMRTGSRASATAEGGFTLVGPSNQVSGVGFQASTSTSLGRDPVNSFLSGVSDDVQAPRENSDENGTYLTYRTDSLRFRPGQGFFFAASLRTTATADWRSPCPGCEATQATADGGNTARLSLVVPEGVEIVMGPGVGPINWITTAGADTDPTPVPTPVPLPAGAALLITALAGLWRFRAKSD